MRAIALAVIYLASEVSLASRRHEGAKLTLGGLITDSVINIIALGGFLVCIILGD